MFLKIKKINKERKIKREKEEDYLCLRVLLIYKMSF